MLVRNLFLCTGILYLHAEGAGSEMFSLPLSGDYHFGSDSTTLGKLFGKRNVYL